MTVTATVLLNGCAPDNSRRLTACSFPPPAYPREAALMSAMTKIPDRWDPFWIYFHHDMQMKCAQERYLGRDCTFNPDKFVAIPGQRWNTAPGTPVQ